MAKIESSSSMKKSVSQVESMEMRKREVQGEYSTVKNTSNSPEHRKLEGAVADGPGGEGVDNTDHESIQVVVSENIADVESKGVKFDKQAFVLWTLSVFWLDLERGCLGAEVMMQTSHIEYAYGDTVEALIRPP